MPQRIISFRSWSIIAGFVFGILVIAGAALLNELQQENDKRVRQSLIFEAALAELRSVVQDAESGQRGYLLTGDQRYLEPYVQAFSDLGNTITELATTIDREPEHRANFERLRVLISDKLAELRTTVHRREAGDAAGALAIIQGDAGESLSRQIRNIIKEMSDRESRQLDAHLSHAALLANLLRIGIIVAAVIIIILAFYTVRQAYRRAAIIVRQRDELEAANEALLLEKSTREAAESQVRQLQKMEAIGQLTGGVAHDFNNMLAVIVSSFELIQKRLAEGRTDVGKFVESGMDATQRAAALTKRLLAFARQQPLEPTGFNPNELLSGMSDMLRRTLGTNIVVETVLASGLWPIYADKAQLESTIVNLCVNARDAMADGGRLTIETANTHLDDNYARATGDVAPGQYTMIAITDTGIGMSADVIRKAFDPFFTTKEVGRGTGLGLSQVYGFVKQSGGHVKIDSEVGKGTSVKIYLPRYVAEEADRKPPEDHSERPASNGHEVLLVVEDEQRVRNLSVAALTELGYRVFEADGAESALRQLRERPEIQLMFTDIVMPEVDGRKLAAEALRYRPDLKVLYTTGFTRNAVVHGGTVDPGVHLLQKPYTLDELAQKVRQLLGPVAESD